MRPVKNLILTAADPTTEGLSVVTRKELAKREREADADRRALDGATEVLNRDRRLNPRRWSPAVALVLSLFGGCDEVTQRPASSWEARRVGLAGIVGLSDCALYSVKTPVGLPNLHVVRCPGSSTTTTWYEQQGKQRVRRQVTTVDAAPDMARPLVASCAVPPC